MSHAPWLKRVVIPFWVVDLALALALLIFSAVNINLVYRPDGRFDGTSVDPWQIVAIVFSVISLIFTITEIILFAKLRLHPVVAVVLNSIATTAWLYFSAQTITDWALGVDAAVLWPLVLVLFVSALGKLIYSSVILDRLRKGSKPALETATATPAASSTLPAVPSPRRTTNPRSTDPFQDPPCQPSPIPSMRENQASLALDDDYAATLPPQDEYQQPQNEKYLPPDPKDEKVLISREFYEHLLAAQQENVKFRM